MFSRLLFRSSILAGILLACFAHLVWNGWHAKRVLAENLPHPLLSSGKRDIDLWVPTSAPGRLYDLTFVLGETTERLPPDARLKIQLASNGRTRLLVVRPGHPKTDVSWWTLLTGREKLQVVADRDWIDLGPAPGPGETLEVQLSGLLPGPYGFAQLLDPTWPHFKRILAVRPESPRARPTQTTLRYRFDRVEPVPARETLARFFFFISCSRVLQVTGIAALVLLLTGWWWLWDGRVTRAVACLVPAVTLLHACCLPPFQGADAVNHVGTAEASIFSPELFGGPWAYPKSLARVYDAIGYDRFAGSPDVPVPLTTPELRRAARPVLSEPALDEAREAVSKYRDAGVLDARARAPIYYSAFRLLRPLAQRMSVLDRVESYVVSSAAASLLLFCGGLLLIARAGLGTYIQLLYGLVALVPYSVGVVASCSNYSPAIGIGALLAACALVVVLSGDTRSRLLAGALLVGTAAVGVGIWDDFIFVAAAGSGVALVVGTTYLVRRKLKAGRRPPAALVASAALAFLAAVYGLLASGRAYRFFASLAARRPKELGGPGDPTFWVLLGTAAAPFVVTLLFALFLLRARDVPDSTRRSWARARTAAVAALFLGLFLVLPFATVPYEFVRLDLADEVAVHWRSFWSNNFAWDQDVLSWKMYWGVFGYADVLYPPVIYALARWLCVGIFLALPVLSVRFTSKRPVASAQLLIISGYALAACVVTNSIRHLAPALPWGRFLLPFLPLVALPVLVRTDSTISERHATILALGAVILHLWTAITLLGSRYAVGA